MKTIIVIIIVFSLLSTLNKQNLQAFNRAATVTNVSHGKVSFISKAAAFAISPNQSNYAGNPYLRLQLAKDAINTDDIMVRFVSNATNDYDLNMDAPYFMGNGKVNLCSLSGDNVALAINALPFPKNSVAIKLKVGVKADGAYNFNLTQLTNVPVLFDVWLMDAYKKDSVNLRRKATYSFNVLKSDTNSYGSGRFSLVVRQNPALAVHLSDFSIKKAAGGTEVDWTTENEQDYTNFTVEKSTDKGETFKAIDSLISNGLGTYTFSDNTPVNGTEAYRLKLEDISGTLSYSQAIALPVIKSNNVSATGTISVYPNPAASTLNLVVNPVLNANLATSISDSPDTELPASTPKVIYLIKIVSTTNGAVIRTATSNQQTWQTDLSELIPGTYVIQVLNNKDRSLVGKGTFIKL